MIAASNTQNVLGRFLFASLVTYMATQAHGWAGGVATPYAFTALTWAAVVALSFRIQSRALLLVLSLGVQLIIHVGTMAGHVHAMNTSEEAMLLGHVVAGVAAWAITVLSEDRFTAFSVALSLFRFSRATVAQIKTFYWTIKTFCTQQTNFRFSGRSPPALSSN